MILPLELLIYLSQYAAPHIQLSLKCLSRYLNQTIKIKKDITFYKTAIIDAAKYNNIEIIKIILGDKISGDVRYFYTIADNISSVRTLCTYYALTHGNIQLAKYLSQIKTTFIDQLFVSIDFSESVKYTDAILDICKINKSVCQLMIESLVRHKRDDLLTKYLNGSHNFDVTSLNFIYTIFKFGNSKICDIAYNYNKAIFQEFYSSFAHSAMAVGNLEVLSWIEHKFPNIINDISCDPIFNTHDVELIINVICRGYRIISETWRCAIKLGNVQVLDIMLDRSGRTWTGNIHNLAISYKNADVIKWSRKITEINTHDKCCKKLLF